MCACACVFIRKLTVLYYIHTRRGKALQAQERQHPEKLGAFLSFLFSLRRQPTGPAARKNSNGETEERCVKTSARRYTAPTVTILKHVLVCLPSLVHSGFLHLVVPRAGGDPQKPSVLCSRPNRKRRRNCASDHAAAVARQHDYVHSLLLGNQHFPSHTHTATAAAQGS